jgi:hypothetical protein
VPAKLTAPALITRFPDLRKARGWLPGGQPRVRIVLAVGLRHGYLMGWRSRNTPGTQAPLCSFARSVPQSMLLLPYMPASRCLSPWAVRLRPGGRNVSLRHL